MALSNSPIMGKLFAASDWFELTIFGLLLLLTGNINMITVKVI